MKIIDDTMSNGSGDWASKFPIEEKVEDFAGNERTFLIEAHETGHGFIVRASERTDDGAGYSFEAFGESSPFTALGRLRQKMYRALATRHLTGSPGSYGMLHDKLSGRISTDEHGEAILVVDGVFLSIENLESILTTHEGFQIEIKISEPAE